MNNNPLLSLIENVLQDNKDRQINLSSNATCRVIAEQIAEAVHGKYYLVAHRNQDDLK